MRDDFSEEVKRTLAHRVSNDCSNPDCHAPTSGPQSDSTKALNIGVAAHITSASPGGPRFNPSLTPEQRCHADNGIWLCQNCAKLIDNDVSRFSETLLRAWKTVAEDYARNKIGKTATAVPNEEANRLTAALLAAMQPEKEKIRPRLLLQKGKSVMVWRESQRLTYQPSAAILVDVNEDSVVLRVGGSGNSEPYAWPLAKIAVETDVRGCLVIVFDDSGIRSR